MNARVALRALALVAAGLASGCYWSSPPSTPHRSVRFDVGALPELGAPKMPALAGTRLVVLGRFDTTAGNPVGGLYDRKDYEVSPLQRTYFFKDGAVEVFEHVSDGLRASGLLVLKDYAGRAEPALLEPAVRAQAPTLVTATVTALQHDQIRDKKESVDVEAGLVEIALLVRDAQGKTLLQKTYRIEGRYPYDGVTDMLKLLGWKLAEQLATDPAFVAAVGAQKKA